MSSKSIEIERTLVSTDWPTPMWAKKGEYEVPAWLYKWAKQPCDMLFKGRTEHITTLAYLLLKVRPHLCVQRAELEEINPIRDPETDKEFRLEWGGKYPLLADVLFVTDVVGNMNDWMKINLRKVVKARRSSRKLTIIHYLDGIVSWDGMGIDIPLLVEVD